MKLNKILVPLDGSTLAEAAIETAVDLAAGANVTYALIRAAEAHRLPVADPTDAQVEVVRQAETYLDAARERLATRGITNVTSAVWYGAPAAAIIAAAQINRADLIVMSSHGRSGLGRLILGSVAEAVLRGTTVPVCVVRVPGAPLDLPKDKAEAAAEKAPVSV